MRAVGGYSRRLTQDSRPRRWRPEPLQIHLVDANWRSPYSLPRFRVIGWASDGPNRLGPMRFLAVVPHFRTHRQRPMALVFLLELNCLRYYSFEAWRRSPRHSNCRRRDRSTLQPAE